jgi:hypothetical protein
MKNLIFVVMLGCSSNKGADCEKAIDHSMELSKTPTKMRDIAVQRCKEDNWSDDALACMAAANSETDAQACYGKLTPEQQDKMNKAAMAQP